MMIKNQRGFSLIELMVYVGLLGAVAMIIATLSTNVHKSSVVIQADLRVAEFMQDLQLKISKKGVCDYNFLGEASTQDPVASIQNLDGSTLYAVNDSLDNYFTIASMSLTKVDLSRADFSITLNRRGTNQNAIGTITRTLKLYVVHETDGTTIKSCMFSLDEFTGDQLPLLCNGEGTILSDEATPADTSDDICIHAGYSVELCPAGEAVKRYELVTMDDGSGNLQPYYRPICLAIDFPTNLSCPPGEILQGYSNDDGLVCRPLVASDIQNYFLGDYTNCSATQTYPIFEVGPNININCGAAVAVPSATPTPAPTVAGNPSGQCETVSASEFLAGIELDATNNLNPTVRGRAVRIKVRGTEKGSALAFDCLFVTNGTQTCVSMVDSVTDALWPGTIDQCEASTTWLFATLKRSNDYGGLTYNFSCGASTIWPAYVSVGIGCAGTLCERILGPTLTGLEDTATLTICAEDTESADVDMYDHADPFDVQ